MLFRSANLLLSAASMWGAEVEVEVARALFCERRRGWGREGRGGRSQKEGREGAAWSAVKVRVRWTAGTGSGDGVYFPPTTPHTGDAP